MSMQPISKLRQQAGWLAHLPPREASGVIYTERHWPIGIYLHLLLHAWADVKIIQKPYQGTKRQGCATDPESICSMPMRDLAPLLDYYPNPTRYLHVQAAGQYPWPHACKHRHHA